MATGLTAGERAGADGSNAATSEREPHPLPREEVQPHLVYENKIDKACVVAPLGAQFCEIDRTGRVKALRSFDPNCFVLSDNLLAMNALLESYAGKVTLAYLDPPYATGLDFQSRSQQHAYNDAFGAAAYIEFMRRRMILLRELLAPDGSMYVHIGHQMLFHLKVILDEIFGAQNFRNLILRKKCSSKNYTRNRYANLHDYILFYSRSKTYKWNQPSEEPDEEWLNREYPKSDEKGRYKLVPIHAPGVRRGETGGTWRGMSPPPGKHWQYTPARLEEIVARGEMHWSKNGNPRRKVYLSPTKVRPLTDYWMNFRDAHHQSIEITGYPTEKNLDMLRVIVGASSDRGDLVIDPFTGSGTTLQAAEEGGRDWIGIDASAAAAEATLRRLRHGVRPMGDYVPSKQTAPTTLALDLDEPAAGEIIGTSKQYRPFRFVVESEFLSNHETEVCNLAKV